MAASRVRPRPGDIYEVATPRGLAYLHYINDNDNYGELVQTFRAFYTTRPDDISTVVEDAPGLKGFYTLARAVRDGLIHRVGHVAVDTSTFPLMRGDGDWFSNGKDEWRDASMPDSERRHLPRQTLYNHAGLIAQIVAEVTDADVTDTVFRRDDGPVAQSNAVSAGPFEVVHYMYFPDRSKATRAAKRAAAVGATYVDRSANDGLWLLRIETLAESPDSDELTAQRTALERIADDAGGDYDGWEART